MTTTRQVDYRIYAIKPIGYSLATRNQEIAGTKSPIDNPVQTGIDMLLTVDSAPDPGSPVLQDTPRSSPSAVPHSFEEPAVYTKPGQNRTFDFKRFLLENIEIGIYLNRLKTGGNATLRASRGRPGDEISVAFLVTLNFSGSHQSGGAVKKNGLRKEQPGTHYRRIFWRLFRSIVHH